MNNTFRRDFSEFDNSIQKKDNEISGELGIYLNGQQYVEVPNRPGFVYVRLRNTTSEVIQAYNDQVSLTFGLPVLVIRQGGRYIIKGRDTERYNYWGTSTSYVPYHGNQHSFNPDGGGGGDPVWVYGRQMMPMAVFPSGTAGAGNVLVYPYQYKKTDGTIINIGLTGTQDMLSYKPTDGNAIMGIVYVDPDVGNPQIVFNSGSPFSNTITGTEEVVPYYPSIANQSYLLLAGIRLTSGTSSILWENIYDLRQWVTPPGTGTPVGVPVGGADGYGVTVLQDGLLIVSGTAIDFIGDGVSVSSSGTRATVDIPGTVGGGNYGVTVQEDGAFKVSGTVLNFTGNGVNVSVTGTTAFININTGTGGGGGGLYASYAKIQQQEASSVNGGTFTQGSYVTRILNTEVYDDDGIVSLSTGTSQFTLGAGTYIINASAPAYHVNNHKAKLYNVTDAQDEIIGTSEFATANTDFATTRSLIKGEITIASSKSFEIRHRCALTRATNGLGDACGFGDIEVYTVVEIWKLA